MSKNISGFNFDKDYELQIKNNGKKTGLTFEFYDDLQKYVDEGVFVDELNDGFTNKEKRGLADAFMRIHKEKGYDTNFSKMQTNTKFIYSANDYIELAKAAGYVLKDLPPEEQTKLIQRIEKSAEGFATTQKPTEDVPASEKETPATALPKVDIKPVELPTQKVEFATFKPAPINPQSIVLPETINQFVAQPSDTAQNPVTTEPEAVEDEFAISDDSAYDMPEVKRVNPDELPLAKIEEPAEEFHLPKSFLKRYRNEQGEMITPDNYKDLPQEKQDELLDIYQKGCKRIAKYEAKAKKNNKNLFVNNTAGTQNSEIAQTTPASKE